MPKPFIVKRNTKGSALTFTELDANFQNLDDATFTLKAHTGGTDVVSDLNGTITLVAVDGIAITGNNTSKEVSLDASVVQDTTPQLGGNLDVNGYSIVSVSNGNIPLVPNGSGSIYLQHGDVTAGGGAVLVGPGTAGKSGLIGARGANDLALLADPLNVSGQAAILLEATDGDVNLSPGPQANSANRLRSTNNIFGTGASAPYATSSGSYALNLTTNGATIAASSLSPTSASGFLQLNTGANGNTILSTSNTGTGNLVLNTFGNFTAVNRQDSASSLGAVQILRRTRSDTTLASMNGVTTPQVFSVRDSTATNSFYGRIQGTYSTTGGHSFQVDISSDNFTTTIRSLAIENLTLALGPTTGTQAQTITTGHAGNLVLNTNRGTTSGSITIATGANGAITLDPNGTGKVTLSTNTVEVGNLDSSTVNLDNPNETTDFYVGNAVVSDPDTYPSIKFHKQVNVSGLDSGNVTILANNYGRVVLDCFLVELPGSQAAIAGNGTRLDLTDGGAVNSSSIAMIQAGDVEIVAHSNKIKLGNLNTSQTITTNGSGNLTLNTADGTNSPNIELTYNDGIKIRPYSGSVLFETTTGTDLLDIDSNRIFHYEALRGSVLTGQTVSKGGTYTPAATDVTYHEIEITNTGAGTSVAIDVTNLTVNGEGGHYAFLIYNNAGSNMDLDIKNNGNTLTNASKNLPNGSRHIATIYCVGNYAAAEVMDAV